MWLSDLAQISYQLPAEMHPATLQVQCRRHVQPGTWTAALDTLTTRQRHLARMLFRRCPCMSGVFMAHQASYFRIRTDAMVWNRICNRV